MTCGRVQSLRDSASLTSHMTTAPPLREEWILGKSNSIDLGDESKSINSIKSNSNSKKLKCNHPPKNLSEEVPIAGSLSLSPSLSLSLTLSLPFSLSRTLSLFLPPSLSLSPSLYLSPPLSLSISPPLSPSPPPPLPISRYFFVPVSQ